MWKRKKKDNNLELTGEEHEVSLTTPLGGYKKKKIYGKKETKQPEQTTTTPAKKQEEKPEPIVYEDSITVEAEHYEEISLGNLKRGTTVNIECRELKGKNFSYYLLDSVNMSEYRKECSVSKSISKGIDNDEHEDKVKIRMAGQYYFVITSKAWEYDRNVWYRIEIGGKNG